MATVPVTRTAVTGEVTIAAHFNDNIRDPLNYLLAKPILKVRQTGAQSIPNNAHTAQLFDAEDVDSSGMHSTSVNTSRATAVYPGYMSPSGGISFAGNATATRGSYWAKSGTPINGSNTLQSAVQATAYQAATRADLVFFNVGDYCELFVYQNSGGALNTSVTAQEQPSMAMRWESN